MEIKIKSTISGKVIKTIKCRSKSEATRKCKELNSMMSVLRVAEVC